MALNLTSDDAPEVGALTLGARAIQRYSDRAGTGTAKRRNRNPVIKYAFMRNSVSLKTLADSVNLAFGTRQVISAFPRLMNFDRVRKLQQDFLQIAIFV